jgi:hypothetical protein
VGAVAVVSLSGTEKTDAITHSKPFLVFGIIIIIRSLGAVASSVRNKSNIKRIANIFIHLGVVLGLAGVLLNERSPHNGYVFLELEQGGKNFYLNRNLKTINELPGILQLDSITDKYTKAFSAAPVAHLHYCLEKETSAVTLSFNKPFNYLGQQLLFSNIVEPGFPHSYTIIINNEQYLLLHNQRLQLPDKKIIFSHAYDAADSRLGYFLGQNEYWLQAGQSRQIDNCSITLESVNFSRNPGVILMVKDITLRYLIYAGFGIMLLGLFIYLFDKKKV